MDTSTVALCRDPPLRLPRSPPDFSGLSVSQERMWIFEQLHPGTIAQTFPLALRLKGPLDAEVLTEAIETVATRHPILKTCFPSAEGRPATRRLEEPIVAARDLSSQPSLRRTDVLKRFLARLVQAPIDICRAPPLRCSLLRLGAEDHVLLFVCHHIAFDAWSVSVVLKELSAIYHAYLGGEPAPLDPDPAQYSDYVYWQEGALATRQALPTWAADLELADLDLPLPLDRGRPARPAFLGGRIDHLLGSATTSALQRVARELETSYFVLLVGCLQLALAVWCGRRSVPLAIAVTTRTADRRLESIVGPIMNTLLVRAELRPAEGLPTLLRRVAKSVQDALQEQDYPFESIVSARRLRHTVPGEPLIRAMVIFQNVPAGSLYLDEVDVEAVEVDRRASEFDLCFVVKPAGSGSFLILEYNAEIFEQGTMARFVEAYIDLLQAVSIDPGRPVAALARATARSLGVETRWASGG